MRTSILGMFYARDPLALRGLSDAPYRVMGRHAVCGENVYTDGGAAVCVWGRGRGLDGLRSALSKENAPQRADASASEIALAAYRLWGDRALDALKGPVCSMILDRDAGKLILSRDDMGELPLFYAHVNGMVAFCDRPEALLRAPGVQRTVDGDGLCELFALGPARTPGRTPFRDIRELEPGQTLVADQNGVKVRQRFSLEAREHEHDEKRTIETVRELLEDAMREIIPLRPSCMLSGGLDSSVLTALLAHMSGETPSTFSVDYEEEDAHFVSTSYRPARDAPFARMAAEAVGAKHICIELSVSQLADSLGDALQARGFPGMGDIDSSLLLFSRSIASRAGTALMGECADEVFGGYPWFHRPELLSREGFPWSGSLPLRESVLRPELREKLRLSQYASARYHETCAKLPVLSGEDDKQARKRRLQGLTLRYFMPNLQERANRMLGAADIQPLTPFCDARLVQYLYNVPWSMKDMGGRVKGLLREAARDLLPESLLLREKSPYPKVCHPRYAEILRGRMFALAEDRRAPLWRLCDREAVIKLAASRLSAADTPWYGQLMAGPQLLAYLLQIETWLRETGAEPDASQQCVT